MFRSLRFKEESVKGPIIALFSPSANAASETFVQAHRDNLDAKVKFYSDGWLPSRINGIPLVRLRHRLIYSLLGIAKVRPKMSLEEYSVLRSLKKERVELILCEFGPTASCSLAVAKKAGLPMIVYFHGYDMSIRDTIKRFRRYKEVIDYADKLFVVSKDMKKKILKFGAKPEKVIYNPCAPNDSFFNVKRNKEKGLVFIGAGRFTNKKAPHLTILAFKSVLLRYPDAKLILAGNGELHQVCTDLVKIYDIESSVHLPGTFNSRQLEEWFGQAIAFVQHSVTAENGDQEGTPVAVLEAMAAGLPVVATRHAGIKDVVVEDETGYLVEEHDIEGMAGKMCKLIENKALREVMGEEGRKRIQVNFSMSAHIGKINDAVKEVLEEK